MAICPFAVQQIIPESHTQGWITPTTLIYHRAVSSAESLQGYWNTPGVELESHFYIGQFGTIYQFMDTNVRADANVDANGFAISVETWDGGNTPDDMPWNPAQLASAKRLAAWACETHGVRRGAAQTWNGGGIGGHNWFPYPWAGGPRGCPGTARNAQIRNDIIPYVVAGNGWRDAVAPEDDMTPDQEKLLAEAHNFAKQCATVLGSAYERNEKTGVTWDAGGRLRNTHEALGDAYVGADGSKKTIGTRVKEMDARLGRIEQRLDGLTTGTGHSLTELAAALADELDRRARDNDSTTGPTS